MNKRTAMRLRERQFGAATVEAALILVVFLVLIFGVMEFALLIFSAASLVEATRTGSRYLIVNTPVTDIYTEGFCDSDPPPELKCEDSDVDCAGLLAEMQKYYEPLQENNLRVTYRCSETGNKEAPFYVYEVELKLENVKYNFVTPGIFGFDGTVTLPDFKSTKMSEDLETVVPAS